MFVTLFVVEVTRTLDLFIYTMPIVPQLMVFCNSQYNARTTDGTARVCRVRDGTKGGNDTTVQRVRGWSGSDERCPALKVQKYVLD